MKSPIQFFSLSLLAIFISTIGVNAFAQQSPKPEQLIKWRQSAFQVIAWNNSRIKANLEGTFNKEDVIKASSTIAAIANAGLGTLFVSGTETGKGWHETSTKPELFAANSKVAEYTVAFSKESNELAKLSVTGDIAKIKEQFGKLGRTCKSCHDDYKSKD